MRSGPMERWRREAIDALYPVPGSDSLSGQFVARSKSDCFAVWPIGSPSRMVRCRRRLVGRLFLFSRNGPI